MLFGMIGRKESVGGIESLLLNASAQPVELHPILPDLRSVEESGIPSVEVKFVDIGRNTRGEGDHLDGH